MKLPRAHHLPTQQLASQLFIIRYQLQFQNLDSTTSQRLITLQKNGVSGWQFCGEHPSDIRFWSSYLAKIAPLPLMFLAVSRCGMGEIVPQATKFPDIEELFKSCDDETIETVYEVIGREARAMGYNALAGLPANYSEANALLYSLSLKMMAKNIYPVYYSAHRQTAKIATCAKIRTIYCMQLDRRLSDSWMENDRSVVIANWDPTHWQTMLSSGVTMFSLPFDKAVDSIRYVENIIQLNSKIKMQVCKAVDKNIGLKKKIAALKPAQPHPNRIYKVIGDPAARRLSEKLFSMLG